MYDAQPNANHFLRQWLAHSLVLWPIVVVASVLAWLPLAILMVFLAQGSDLPFILRIINSVALMLIPGAAVGYCAGTSQLNLMRDHLKWQPKNWIHWSTIGGTLGSFAVLMITITFRQTMPSITQLMIAMPLFALCYSLGQWWTIRESTREAWMWILGNVVGGIVFSGLLFLNQPDMTIYGWQKVWMVAMWAFAVLGQATVTGIVLLWLYERPLPEQPEDAEYAHVYVEVHDDSYHR